MNEMDIVVISPPGRRRENLLTMLESIDHLDSVTATDSCTDFSTLIDTKNPVTVFVDYRYPEKQLDREVSSLIMHEMVDHVVLLQARNAPKSHFTHYSTSDVIYDELTVGVLNNLLTNIATNAI